MYCVVAFSRVPSRMSTDDGFPTSSSQEQQDVERDVLRQFGAILNREGFDFSRDVQLFKEAHVDFLTRGLTQPLRPSFISLEASQPWIVYWILHALDLLGQRELIVSRFASPNIAFLSRCQNASGGFGGGPGQISHLATTYAAVAALVTIGTPDALASIDRDALSRFLHRMKDPVSGAFRMHDDGEIDMRGTYCAIAVASLVGVLDPALIAGVGEYVKSCQTYEGGIAGEPGMEAHGGYAYCGLAALAIVGDPGNYIDLEGFLEWVGRRQMPLEGGFQGRANKLVDSCYTFWQGAAVKIIEQLLDGEKGLLCSPGPAQLYVLLACQHPEGGLRDKPGKSPDFYHTCYSLSGLAALDGGSLEPNSVLYNITQSKVDEAVEFFRVSR
jgi:protein farnesyltransferase subunit beta